MPTHNDETLLERYQREHRVYEGMKMSEHTPGKLAVSASLFDNEGCPETVIVGVDKNAFVAVAIDFGENNPNMREANARRLVAAWNYCDGLDTAGMALSVEMDRPIKVFINESYGKELELIAERDRLSAINAELLEALNWSVEYAEAVPADMGCNLKKWAVIGRAAIAKAQGEQL